MSQDKECEHWWIGKCVLSAARDDVRSKLCVLFDRCMYAAPRESFTAAELEVLDAWSHARICLLAYRP